MQEHEIEIQVQVERTEGLLTLLEQQGDCVGETRQIDEYFVPAHRDFLARQPIEEWLRLRTTDTGSSLNYKKWHFDSEGKGLYADEYETKVENIEAGRRILFAIDARPIITVDKLRKSWNYKDYEISIDTVKGLGEFVEVEYKGGESVSTHADITQAMIKFLKDSSCGTLILNHTGYPALLLGRKEKQEILT